MVHIINITYLTEFNTERNNEDKQTNTKQNKSRILEQKLHWHEKSLIRKK